VRVYDIGANCGLYAIPLAAAAAEGSMVHAFEPSPVMAARLERNVALNALGRRVRGHRVALGGDASSVTLNVHPKNHGQSSLRALDGPVERVEVEQRPLLDAVDARQDERHAVDTTLMKIDVEGHEDSVLCPFLYACPEIALPDALLVEMVLEHEWRQDLRAALARRGYRVVFEGEGNALFERAAPAGHGPAGGGGAGAPTT